MAKLGSKFCHKQYTTAKNCKIAKVVKYRQSWSTTNQNSKLLGCKAYSNKTLQIVTAFGCIILLKNKRLLEHAWSEHQLIAFYFEFYDLQGTNRWVQSKNWSMMTELQQLKQNSEGLKIGPYIILKMGMVLHFT